MAAPAVRQHQVLYRRPASLSLIKDTDDWSPSDGAAIPHQPSSPMSVAHSPTNGLPLPATAGAPTPRGGLALSSATATTPSIAAAAGIAAASYTNGRKKTPQNPQQDPRQHPKQQHHLAHRSANGSLSGQAPSPTSDELAPTRKPVARPVSADAAPSSGSNGGGARTSGTGYSARISGGSPNLNAAAAVAERQAMAEMVATLRPSYRGRTDSGPPPSSIGSCKKDVEALAEELRRVRSALSASQEQNRILRTERQRLDEELGRCRTSLVKAEEMLNTREKVLSPNAAMSCMYRTTATTNLVNKLREQLAMQQAQTEGLKAQLDELMRGTRATRVSELQAEVKAQDQELRRQSEMVALMRQRMDEAEARAAEAISKGLEAERLARMQVPLAVLQHAISVSEVKLSSTVAKMNRELEDKAGGNGSPASPAGGTGTADGASAAATKGARSGSGGGGDGGDGGTGSGAAGEGACTTPDGSSRLSSSVTTAGAQSLSSSRIRKTMAVLGDAHRALLSQATLLSEIFPPGLTTEQLSIRSALRPATSGAPEVLRYLRHHVHRLVDALSSLPGSRVEFVPEDEGFGLGPTGGGSWSSPAARRGRNGRHSAVRISHSGGGGGGGAARMGGRSGVSGGSAGGGSGGGAGPTSSAAGSDECDPWNLVGELLDFVRWLRGLDDKCMQARPELESGLEQVASLVGICGTETKRLLAGGSAGQEQAP